MPHGRERVPLSLSMPQPGGRTCPSLGGCCSLPYPGLGLLLPGPGTGVHKGSSIWGPSFGGVPETHRSLLPALPLPAAAPDCGCPHGQSMSPWTECVPKSLKPWLGEGAAAAWERARGLLCISKASLPLAEGINIISKSFHR